MLGDTEGRDQKAGAEAQRGNEHRLARSGGLDPAPEHRGGQSEEHNRDRKDPAELRQRPVAGRRLGVPISLLSGRLKVENAYACPMLKMHRQSAAGGTR